MKIAKLMLIIVLGAAIVLWIRAGEDFHIATTVPLLGGYEPGGYDVAGVILGVIAYIGWRRLNRIDGDRR